MRNWLFHPLVFYPLAIIIAVVVIAISIRPQAWPREPARVAAQVDGAALIYRGEGFDAPSPAPQQHMIVVRDFWGHAQALRIAVLSNQPAPAPTEQGVRILMRPEDAARIDNRPVTVEIAYNALPVNASSDLAVSLQGSGPTAWVNHPTPPDDQVLRVDLPAQSAVNAIGLRALQEGQTEAFGIEITRIRIIPRA